MIVQPFPVGKFLTNCYVAICPQTREAIIIDPSFENSSEGAEIVQFIERKVSALKFIVNTHGHPDHTCGNGIMKEKFHAPIIIHEFDAHMLGDAGKMLGKLFGFETFSPPADNVLRENDVVSFGKISLKVVTTPGHSRGSMSLLGRKEIFTGDTLFAGSIGRTDFPESSGAEMQNSLKKLKALPDSLLVYPGHGPVTTLGDEKRANPFLITLH